MKNKQSDSPILMPRDFADLFHTVDECKLHKQINQHSQLTIRGAVYCSEINRSKLFGYLHQPIDLLFEYDNGQYTWRGLVTSIDLKYRGSDYQVVLTAQGMTLPFDNDQRRTESYLFPQTPSFEQLLSKVNPSLSQMITVSTGVDSLFKQTFANQSDDFFWHIRYEENDWQYLMRVASSLQQPLLIEEREKEVNIHLGFLDQHERFDMKTSQEILSIQLDQTGMVVESSSRHWYWRPGLQFKMDNELYVVVSAEYHMWPHQHTGAVYKLMKKSHWTPDYLEIYPTSGKQYVAEVIDRKDPKSMGRLAVRFPWESNQAEAELKLRWLQWASSFTANEVGLYALPEVGERVYVHFVGPEDWNAYAALSERSQAQPVRFAKDGMQWWRNAGGAQIEWMAEPPHLILSVPDRNQKDEKRVIALDGKQLLLTYDDVKITMLHKQIEIENGKSKVVVTDGKIEISATALECNVETVQFNGKSFKVSANTFEVKSDKIQIK
jgi:hypothetical protein